MPFESLQTFQSDMENAIRNLSSQQLTILQKFGETQRKNIGLPSAWTTPETYTQLQSLMTEFVQANQNFVSSSVSATQSYWAAQAQENQTAFDDVKNTAEDVKRQVEKVLSPSKSIRKATK